MMKRIFLTLATVLLVGGVTAWLFWLEHPQENSTPAEQTQASHHERPQDHDAFITISDAQAQQYDIQTEQAGPGRLALTVTARGRVLLHPDRLAHILPKVSGVATEAYKNIGDRVHAGDLLAIVESREMADIKANYLSTVERLKLTQGQFEREKKLLEKKVSAEQDYLTAESAYEEAKINMQLAKQKLIAYGLTEKELETLAKTPAPNLRLYDVRAPIDGIIIKRDITKGEYIEGNTTIYEIADLSRIWVEAGIYPKDVSKIKEGQVMQLTMPDSGTVCDASIIYISPIIDEETIATKVVAELDNTCGQWRPGTFVTADITTDKVPVTVLAPREAIQMIDGQEVVFIKKDGGFERRNVRLGRGNKDKVEIVAGVQPGESFARSSTFLLKADLSKEDGDEDDD